MCDRPNITDWGQPSACRDPCRAWGRTTAIVGGESGCPDLCMASSRDRIRVCGPRPDRHRIKNGWAANIRRGECGAKCRHSARGARGQEWTPQGVFVRTCERGMPRRSLVGPPPRWTTMRKERAQLSSLKMRVKSVDAGGDWNVPVGRV